MELGSSKKSPTKGKKDELYHVIHKVPSGDTPYVRAKHAQVCSSSSLSVSLSDTVFWDPSTAYFIFFRLKLPYVLILLCIHYFIYALSCINLHQILYFIYIALSLSL